VRGETKSRLGVVVGRAREISKIRVPKERSECWKGIFGLEEKVKAFRGKGDH